MKRSFETCGLAVFWLVASATGLIAQSAPDLAIFGARIYVGNGEVVENGTVLVRGGKIAGVLPGTKIPSGVRRVELPGAIITPGLIDAAARGVLTADPAEHASEIIPQYRVLDTVDVGGRRMMQLAREGVTTIFATASEQSIVGPQGAVLKTGPTAMSEVLVEAGDPKLVLSHGPSGGNARPRRGRPFTVFTRRPTTQMGILFEARHALGQARNELEAQREGGGSGDAALAKVAEILGGNGRFRVQVDEQYEIAAALELSREFGFELVIENGLEAWRMTDDLKAAGVPVIYGPVLVDSDFQDQASLPWWMRSIPPRKRLATAKALVDAKLTVALTARAQVGESGLVRQAMHAMRFGLSRAEALAAVTSVPAELLGVAGRVGRLEAGLDADLVVWNGEPFDAVSRPVAVFIGGRRVPGRTF